MQTEKETIDSWLEYLPINERRLHLANRRISQLETGPGGIMEMKQTIADKEREILVLETRNKFAGLYAENIEKENDRLQKFEIFTTMIANEQLELSYEKIEIQRNWWKNLAIELVKELENDDEQA